MHERRADIEAVKGLAILLVVFGHLVARQDPAGVGWYEPLRRAVYAFHMPLFLYLSGLVAVQSGFLAQRRAALPRLAGRRARRLLVPFFGLGLLTVFGKCALAGVLHVDNVPAGLGAGMLDLLWHTGRSPALSVWYLFVLFTMSLACVALLDGALYRIRWLLAGALVLFWLPFPAYVYLDRIFTFAPFFLLGTLAAYSGPRWEVWMDRAWPWMLAVFGGCLVAVAVLPGGNIIAQKTVLLLVGSISLPAIHGGVRHLPSTGLQQTFLLLGRYSFMIYLFNTLFIGLTKGLLLRVCSWNGGHFPLFAAVLMSAGLLGPMAVKYYAFTRIKFLDRLTA